MSRGGNRKGAGRTTIDGATDLISIRVTLPAPVVEEATQLGEGNVSLGLRMLLTKPSRAATKAIEPSAAVRAARAKRPLTEEAYIERECRARDVVTPSIVLHMKLQRAYQDYLKTFM